MTPALAFFLTNYLINVWGSLTVQTLTTFKTKIHCCRDNSLIICLQEESIQWWIQNFPDGEGRQSMSLDVILLFGKIFAENSMKMKQIIIIIIYFFFRVYISGL